MRAHSIALRKYLIERKRGHVINNASTTLLPIHSLPCNTLQEGLRIKLLNRPVRNGNADPVETSACDLSKVFLGDESSVMLLNDLGDTTAALVSSNGLAEGPFVKSNSASVARGGLLVGLVKGRRDERLKNEPAAEVNAK